MVLHENGHAVTLWSYDADDVAVMLDSRCNRNYLPEITIPEAIHVTGDLGEAAYGKDIVLISTPSQFVRGVLERLDPEMFGSPFVVNVAKGIERETLLRMSELVQEVFPSMPSGNYAVLSGPSHAEEVVVRIPTSVVCASADLETSRMVQAAFSTDYLRIYSSMDVVGVELGGSLKNVIAIGAGICDGAGFGDNTKAALITRGIAEIRRLGISLGADPHTFAGLSGLGDLIVTTMSRHSRNRYVGQEIGKGRPLADITAGMKMVAEGIETTVSARRLGIRTGSDLPIVNEVFEILFEGKDPALATKQLMTRQLRDEVW
jgi:glycerol-3-phosphate dehydrogenase (NAD(P)+)